MWKRSYLASRGLSARCCVLMFFEPSQNSRFKLIMRGAPGSGVPGIGNQPQLDVIRRGFGQNQRVAWFDGLIECALNEQHRG